MSQTTEPFLSNIHGDRYLFSVNREDFNEKGASTTFQESLQPSFFKEDTLHLVIGSDSGLLADHLIKKGIPKGARYLFIEPESILKRVESIQAFKTSRIHLGTPKTVFDVLKKEAELGESFYFFLGNVMLHRSIGATHGHLEDYEDIYNQIDEEQQTRHRYHRLVGNTSLHKTNMLLNSATSFHSARCIEDSFKDKTAVIIAPGPSFDEHIDWLKLNRDRLMIISISRVCASLRKNDIVPDIIISIDPITLNYKQSIQMLNFTQTLFVHSSHCNFNMTSLWPDTKINMGDLLPWASKLNESLIPSRGYTVSNMAIDLAAWTGVNQIVLLGVDMCLNQSGDMYTKTEANHAYPITPRLLQVTTNDGEHSMSIPDYVESAKAIALQAAEFKEKGIEIINPSKKAMKIDLVKHIATADIALPQLDKPAAEIIQQCLKEPNKEQHWNKVEKEIRHMLGEIRSVEKKVNSGQSIIKKIKSGKQGNKNPYSQLKKINTQLTESEAATFLKFMNWVEFARISLILESEQEDTAIQGQAQYFDAYAESIRKLKETLNLPLQYISLLREEFKAPPGKAPDTAKWESFFEKLSFNIEYHAGGIYFRWHKLYPEKFNDMPAEVKQDVSHDENPFIENIQELTPKEKTSWSTEQIEKNLSNALTLLHKFKQEKDIDGIDFLISALDRYPEKDAAPYIHLCKGIKAEFQGDIAVAIDEYQQNLELSEAKTLPQALRQIYGICLDRSDLDNAIVALEALSEISPPHIGPYAEVLAVYGLTEAAIENYIKYLHHFPSDPNVPEKLGELLLANDQAQLLLEISDELLKHNSKSELNKRMREKAIAALN